jgi:adenylate cyclase
MKYQPLDKILIKSLYSRKCERLEIDHNFQIVNVSERVRGFADKPEEVVIGKDIRLSFPELVGLESILLSLLDGEEDFFELEGIGRTYNSETNLYIDIYIFSERTDITLPNKLIILIEDATERMIFKQALTQRVNEAKLLSSALSAYKNYMEQVVTSMADALIVTTKTGKIKTVNIAAQQLFGYSETELINQSISIILDDNNFFQQAVQQPALFKKYFQNVELICRNKSHEKLLVSFSCAVIQKKIKGLEDIIYIGRDITSRQRRQQLINTQYAITKILSENQSIKKAMPKLLQAICQNLGWDIGELWTTNQYITTPKWPCINPVLRCVEIWSSRAVSVQQFKSITWQTTYIPGNGLPGTVWETGHPYWVNNIAHDKEFKRQQVSVKSGLKSAFSFPILDDAKTFGIMVFLSQDIQKKDEEIQQVMLSIGHQIAQFIKQKEAEYARLESEERYRDLFENANDLIQSITPYGNFIYVNKAWQKTLGYSYAEISKINVFDIIHPDDHEQCRNAFYRASYGEKIEELKVAFVTKKGSIIFVEGNINCKFLAGKAVATRAIFRNITQRLAAETALKHQQEKTQKLLLNILPEAIANRLKEETVTIAENFASVTVMFADIVGFTNIASEVSPIELVNLLNHIFSSFDRLTEKYQLEKIKTIGDAYMVVGGLPTRRHDHAEAIAYMALDMQKAISQFNCENQQNFSIRIGIHSGPVVAGVIGIKKFTYDLWGDTVNIASRMESQGIPGSIQITETTFNLLKDKFLFTERGEIDIKGKGKMKTYFFTSL